MTTKRNVLVPSLILVLGILTLVSLTQCARMPPGGISLDSDDIGGVVSDMYGVWGEVELPGRSIMGITRGTFLIDEEGVVSEVWRDVDDRGHMTMLAELLGA